MGIGGYFFDFDNADDRRSGEVFADPVRGRRRKTIHYVIAVALVFAAWAISFFDGAFDLKPDRHVLLPTVQSVQAIGHDHPQAGDHTHAETALPAHILLANQLKVAAANQGPDNQAPVCAPEPDTIFAAHAAARVPQRIFAHLPTGLEWAHASLNWECGVINVLMPDWFSITTPELDLDWRAYDPATLSKVGGYIAERGASLELIPTVNLSEAVDSASFLESLQQPEHRQGLVNALLDKSRSVKAAGMCLDFGRVPAEGTDDILRFMADFNSAFSAANLETCVVLGAEAAEAAAARFAAVADYVVVKLYDEPWVETPPGPLAPIGWFEKTAETLRDQVGADKLVLAIGTGSVDWQAGEAVPEPISYSEAVARISAAGGTVSLSKDTLNSYSQFVDTDGERHQMWMLDAVSAHNQMVALDEVGISNVGLWSLGNEDPGIWAMIRARALGPAAVRDALATIPSPEYVSNRGAGAFIRIAAPARPGYRSVAYDDLKRMIVSQRYLELPEPMRLEHFGQGAPNQIALTFDDGPSTEYTREILDILHDTGTPASFFLVGKNMLDHRDLVRRMIDEGHEIGSHTFWHPDMNEISETRAAFELNMFQKLLQSITSHGTVLFREPYERSSGPIAASYTEPLREAQASGYFYAGSDIVPPDWEGISAEEIVADVLDSLARGPSNVIILHDAGADRSETVRAVPMIISALRARGYEFVPLSSFLGLPSDVIMPQIENSVSALDTMSFHTIGSIDKLVVWIFWAAVLIGAFRSIGVLALAFLRRRRNPVLGANFAPPVTIVVPAYNEEHTIIDCVEAALDLDYPNLKVMVVDDGSVDDTFPLVLDKFSRNPRVQIVAQLNSGKWNALNTAIRHVNTGFVVCVDADTRIDKRALQRMLTHFVDPQVGAVAGKVVVANRINLLTRLQALEYIVAQNIDRRAAEYLNAMLVVPGAIGAWRVSAIRAAGGYSGDTLTEDADLTISLLRTGYRVKYEENAVARTVAPTTIKGLLAQRLRWTLGMLQAGWKHRGAVRKPTALGRVALPDLALFGYVLPFLAPVADLLFLSAVFGLVMSYMTGDMVGLSSYPRYVLFAYLVLPLMDIVIALVAILLDGKENPLMVLLFPFQRFFYRQLLYFSVFRALLRALTGRLIRWNKAHRTNGALAGVWMRNAS